MELIGTCFGNQYSKLILLFITLVVSLTSAKPLILSAHEGDRVFIPCFNTPEVRIFYWKIIGSLYPVEELPSGMYFRKTSNGIIVDYTTLSISGEFTCFTLEGRTTLREISTVNFVAQARGLSNYEEPEEYSSTELKLRVTESDTIFIPCIPALGTDNVTIWGIDGSLYPFLELPLYHIYQQGGIIVYNVSRINNASKIYQCYSTEKYIIQKQFTIRLNFYEGQSKDELSTSGFLVNSIRGELELKLVSKGVSLNYDTTYNFQYRIVNASEITTGFCIPGNLTSTLNVTNGTENLWRNDSILLLPEFSPPREVFENAYAEVYSTNSSRNECARLNHLIEVSIDGNITFDECTPEGNGVCCVQEGDQSCVQLPEDLTGLNVIWPRKYLSQQDCVCGVFLPSPLLPDVTFEDCYCLKLGLTTYNVTLIDKRLCWMNLTRDTNDTKIVFVRDIYHFKVDFPVRTFISETLVTIQGLDPFPPMFTEPSPSAVCINSTNPEWNPVQKTITTVYDITGDLIQYTTVDFNIFCLDFKDFPQSCAPFIVNATAYTQCSVSPPAAFNISGTSKDSSLTICECLKDKVELNVTLQEAESTSITLLLSTTCLSSPIYDVDNITHLHLEAVETYCTENCTTKGTYFTIECDQNLTDVTVNNLKEFTTYNLSVIWISPNSSEMCRILKNDIIITTDTVLGRIIAALLIAIIGFIGFIVIIIIIIIIIRRIKKKRVSDLPTGKSQSDRSSNVKNSYQSIQ